MKERVFIVLVLIVIAFVGLKACANSFETLGSQAITEQYNYLREPPSPVDTFTEYQKALVVENKHSNALFYILLFVLILVVLAGCWFIFASGFEKIAKQSKSLKRTFENPKQVPRLSQVQQVPQLPAWIDRE